MIDVQSIREQFPALSRIHNGHPVAYFDGPGGTQVPRVVAEAVTDYLFHHNANTHWHYPTSIESDAMIAESRQAFADLFNSSASEVVFGANMTTLTFHVARGLARRWKAGDEIVVTELDHHANVAPWYRLADECGVVVKQVRMIPERGELDWEDLEKKIGSKTRLLAIGAASNALGTKNDLAKAARLARAAGALVFVDAVHFAAHSLIDVREIDCDFLACSAYKFYGPHIGVLYGRNQLLSEIDVPKLKPSPDYAPERIETGTQNHEGIAGARAAVDFMTSLSGQSAGSRRERLKAAIEGLHDRGDAMFSKLWNGLSSTPGVRVFGPPPGSPRTPTVSFVLQGIRSDRVAEELAERGIFVSHGNFYALTVAERLGYADEGLVRAGLACYSTDDEVERLVVAVRSILAQR
jgi:cysteine desulfurase family protein (TIGR01976 family)